MLKEVIICIIIVTIILIGNAITQNYTKETVGQLSDKLQEIKTELENQNGTSNSGEEKTDKIIQTKIDKLRQDWDESKKKLAYFIEHDELEKVETNIVSFSSFIKSKENEEAISDLDKCDFVLKHIQEKYAFNLENIF